MERGLIDAASWMSPDSSALTRAIVVADGEELERVEMRAAFLPVVLVLDGDRADAGFEGFAARRRRCRSPWRKSVVPSGDDHEMMHGEDGRQVGIRVGERDLDGLVVDGLDTGHLLGDRIDLRADGRDPDDA
jgi:hypothetical protein